MTKHVYLALLFSLSLQQGFAQGIDFTPADPQPVIQEVYGGSILSGDLDGDGDMDLLQSGIGVAPTGFAASAAVFLNDGEGNFSPEEQDFNDLFGTEFIAMGDLDGDGDIDILVMAQNRTDFYRNNGQATFIYDDNAPFQPSYSGELIIGDIDGDDDNDVLQFGTNFAEVPFATLYLNDGTGGFTPAQNTIFSPLLFATIDFIDLEGDGDLDVLSFGKNEGGEAQIGVYENDGAGNYSVFSGSAIAPHSADEISVGDIDNDGDEDVLVAGSGNSNSPQTLLYINGGDGLFSIAENTPFPDVFAGSNAFADLDDDDDLDVLLIGSMAGGIPNIFSIVFENLGNGNFVAADTLSGEYIARNTIADLNGDGKKDIIIQGFVDDTNIYWNETIPSSVNERSEIPFSVSPNPTSGQIRIEWAEAVFKRIDVLDWQGRLVFSGEISEQAPYTFDLAAPQGLYVLRLYGEEGTVSRKILLKP